MDVVFVQDQTALRDLCQRLQDSSWVAIDTEFMRERTYYARLCLIQVATPDVVACIDPLALDVDPLLDLIYAPSRLKVFHAARQDLEVFHDVRKNPPQPIFDTQVAASLLGFDDQIGYGALVQAVTGVKLEKLHTRTDWCVRPLTSQQLRYAQDDVIYLCEVYLDLSRRLASLGRYAWLEEECAALTDPARYYNEADQAYKRIRQGYQLPVAAQAVLKALATWREHTAQTRDLPRNWIAPDSVLFNIAQALPKDVQQLATIEGVTPGLLRKWGVAMLAAVQTGREGPQSTIWKTPVRLDRKQQEVYERLRGRIEEVARDRKINPLRIANRQALQALILERDSCPLLYGWRQKLIGEELGRLRDQALCQR